MALAHRFIIPSCSILSPRNEIQRFSVVHCLATTQTSNPSNNNPITRKSANYKPTIWTYDFVQSLKGHDMDELLMYRANKLEEQVKSMISNEKTEFLTKLELIDDIQRLGLAYHFEQDIKKALHRCAFLVDKIERTEKNLHATALSFRLLRQHGFEVSQDIFKSFKDENGSFKETLCEDVKGMLSLYEASYLAFEGEDLLDEAKEFTIIHLKCLKDESENNLSKQVSHALELPLHHRMLRLEARWYIEEYSKRSDANQVLLEAAKLDFNRVQSVLQRDLKDMSRWWKGIGLADNLSFTRDRLMECFFWTVGMVYEPQFSNLRKGLTKVTSLITIIDDVYDVYGTLEELELFTDAVERWDVSAVNILPDYMKLCFLALYNTVNEMVYDILKEQGLNILPYLTKAWADLFKAFLKEAKWCHRKYTPTFEEYFDNAWMSISGVAILVHAYLLVDKSITKECLDCLENHHNLLRWPSIIFRLCNDLGTSSAEVERGETANSIVCNMRQTGNSEESAHKYLHNLIEETWKKMNKEIAECDSPFTKPFLDTVINLARISQCTYQYGDGHGAPDTRSKNRVLSLIINPI